MKKRDLSPPTILVYTGKDVLNKTVCDALQKALIEQKFSGIAIKTVKTDDEVFAHLVRHPQNNPIMLIVKPSGVSERWPTVVEARRAKMIITVVWSRHAHHRLPAQKLGALFVGIPPRKNGTTESLTRLTLSAIAAIQTHEDDALRHGRLRQWQS